MQIEIASMLEEIMAGVGVCVSAIIAYCIWYLMGKAKSQKLSEYFFLVSEYAAQAVKTVAQTRGDDMKSRPSKLTDGEKTELKAHAVEILNNTLPKSVLKFTKRQSGDFDEALAAYIEAAVRDTKGGDKL